MRHKHKVMSGLKLQGFWIPKLKQKVRVGNIVPTELKEN